MNWFLDLWSGQSMAHAVIAFSAIVVVGLALGHIRFFGISLGIAGVLFAGLLKRGLLFSRKL